MSNLYFPICALFISILLLVVFRSKKRVKNVETQTYSGLLIVNFLDALFGVIIIFLAYNYPNINLLRIFNRLDFPTYLLWAWFFFIYVFYVSTKDKKLGQYYNKMIKITGTFNIIFLVLILLSPFNIINENNIMYANGFAVNILYMAIGMYMVGIITCLIINAKDIINKKYTPIYVLVLLAIFIVIVRIYNPQLLLISAVISYIDLIMYFTIENPDVKMINELEVAREQADKANQAKTDFLSSMSHEIRTPLNAIVGFSDCINNSDTLEEAKENAKDIINASNTLLEIVNGILDISKIEAGKLEITNSKYNARSIFEELAKLITPKMNEKGLDFSYYIAPDLPSTLYGDHANIKKVITNILSNAAKYTEKGFVRYEVNCVNSGNLCKLIISVEDSGRGIKQENIDKLFTKFQRLEEDRNTTIEGTGLGLAITKQLTELMGGKIIVHTVYGQGSKFTVVLPQPIEKEEVKVVEETVKTTLDLKDVKILLVDDNTLNLKVATKLLQRFNANNVTCLEDGFKCISEIESGKSYDVILLDDMMPKMSGVETLKKLKQIPKFNTPVIALTANAITGMREKYLSEGFNEYLAKPIEKEELIKVMNKILEGKRKQEYHQTKTVQPTITPTEKTTDDTVEELLSETEELTPINEEKIQEIEKVPVEPKAIINREEDAVELKKKFLMSKGIDLDKSLELLGDMEMYDMTLNDFVSEADNKWLRIKNYKQIADMKNYAIEVHSLKSDSKYLGFMRLADISYQHELKSKDSDINFVNNHFKELEAEYNRVRATIDEYQSLEKETF